MVDRVAFDGGFEGSIEFEFTELPSAKTKTVTVANSGSQSGTAQGYDSTSIIPRLPSAPGPATITTTQGNFTNYVVASGASVVAILGAGSSLFGGVGTLQVNGVLYVTGSASHYGDLRLAPNNPGVTNFVNTGTFVMHTLDTEFGSNIIALSDGRTVSNSGSVQLLSEDGYAVFWQTWQDATFTNSGLIAVSAPRGIANGVLMVNGGSVLNQAGGQILVEGNAARAVSINSPALASDGSNPVEFTNYGVVTAHRSTAAGNAAIAVSIAYGEAINTGTVTGDYAFIMSGTLTNSGTINGIVASDSFLTINNQAGGAIHGDIIGGDSQSDGPQDVINNAGLIDGNLDLRAGADSVTNSGTGSITGVVYMGFGNDSYVGSSGVDRVAGEDDNDTLNGAGGNDLLMGGWGNDILTGGTGNDGLYGEAGNDTLVVQGGDVASGGTGDDRFELQDLSFRQIVGGVGHDTLVLSSGAMTFDLSAAIATNRISGIDGIELRSAQGIVIRGSDVNNLTDEGILRIEAISGNTVSLVGSWIANGSTVIGGVTYNQWLLGGETVQVRAAANVSIVASAPAGATGLAAIASGAAPLAPGEASGLDYTPDIYQVSWLEIRTARTLNEGVSWVALNGDTAVYSDVDSGFLTIDGTLIASNDSGREVIAIDFMNLSRVVNNGTVIAESYGTLGRGGVPVYLPFYQGSVAMSGGVQLTNNGLIDSYSVYGNAYGTGQLQIIPPDPNPMIPEDEVEQFYLMDAVAVVLNTGTIQAFSEQRYAVGVTGAAETHNDGIIRATGHLGAMAIYAGGSVYNGVDGEISVDSPDGAISIAIYYVSGGGETDEIVNAGLIAGKTAIQVNYVPSGFHLSNSGQIYGDVILSDLVDQVTNTGLMVGNLSLGAGNDVYIGTSGSLNGSIDAGAGNDTVRGGVTADQLYGGLGADSLFGNGGDDVLDGGAGDDRLNGGEGNDTLIGGAGYDRMYGGTGDDTYLVGDADDYAYENPGEGYDRVIASVDHQLRDNVEMLTLTGSAAIGKGNALDNLIIGTDGANRLYGYAGDDRLEGNGGDDYLIGAEGNDTLVGGAGYDRMYGGIGDDTYYVNDATDYAYENAGEGTDRVVSSITLALRANIEELALTGSANLRGYGNALDNWLIGNSGANVLYGGDGGDHLDGREGNDILSGEAGNDLIEGGAGTDRFYGGAGADTFLFRDGDFGGMTSGTADRIHDFSQAEGDRIRLDLVDANVNLAGDQAFSFIGSSAFHGIAGELRAVQQSGVTYVMGDTNGDGQADFWIRLDGLHTLGNSDFVL